MHSGSVASSAGTHRPANSETVYYCCLFCIKAPWSSYLHFTSHRFMSHFYHSSIMAAITKKNMSTRWCCLEEETFLNPVLNCLASNGICWGYVNSRCGQIQQVVYFPPCTWGAYLPEVFFPNRSAYALFPHKLNICISYPNTLLFSRDASNWKCKLCSNASSSAPQMAVKQA